jgi:histidinol dehydrogenase
MSLTNKVKIDLINKRVNYENLLEVDKVVNEIIIDIKNNGDKAIAKYSKKFDKYDFDLSKVNPFQIDLKEVKLKLETKLESAIDIAIDRITSFHKKDLENFQAKEWSYEADYKERLGAKVTALDSVAVYIPGGNAPLVSTLMMTAIPAKIAGVKRIALFSPPQINNTILAVAKKLGVNEVYQIGGAQAIAAAAFGTESITKFNKIVGPGNIYVSEAKKLLNGFIGIDGIYGPSELAILADESADLEKIAIDLLSQLEHGSGLESVLLVSTSQEITNKSKEALIKEVSKINYSEKQKTTILNSIEKWSAFLFEEKIEDAVELINYFAAEHLELQLNEKNLDYARKNIHNAGAIFIGTNSCESLGDYLAGPSHCLPTAGSAKFSSGLQMSDFFKKTSVIDFSKSTKITNLLEATALIARAEGLEAHAKAAEYRIK